MKRFIAVLLFTFLMGGCIHIYELPERTIITGYDFTKYTGKGFLFTPELYGGAYESICLINIESYPEIGRIDKKNQTKRKYFIQGMYIGELDIEKVIDSMYTFARQMGADAIMNFKVEASSYKNGDFDIPGIVISGFAIRRKEE